MLDRMITIGINSNNTVLLLPREGDAGWDKSDNRIVVAPDDAVHYDLASVDVIAHEIAHGLDSYGPKIAVTPPCPEGNKIMEATADMFAMLASEAIEPSGYAYRIMEHPKKANWNGSTFTPTVAERYLDDPTLRGYPACYSAAIACMESHTGSSPAGHMFYLVTYGGTSACNGQTVSGIGVQEARKLWQRMFFVNLPSAATYASLKNAFLDAALFVDQGQPGPTTAAVQAAFAAINMP